MADNEFIYAVARIRSKELDLLSKSDFDQLLACKNYEDCLHILSEKGWGTGSETPEQLLHDEREKTWAFMGELVEDISVFDTFLYENDFHNLKAAIKQVYIHTEVPDIYIVNGTIPSKAIYEAVKEHDFDRLPPYMRDCAEEAYQILMHTGDSQLCDVIIDKSALEVILQKSKASGNELLAEYAQLHTAVADIKIVMRGVKAGKTAAFLERAAAPCDTLDIKKLIQNTLEGKEALYTYLSSTVYSDAVPEIKTSSSAFEKWCDNRIIELIKPQKYNSFSLSPLAAYILARENEIKSVRLLLSGKQNDLPEESIRERLRDMYV